MLPAFWALFRGKLAYALSVVWPDQCAAVVPCFNEERTVPGLVTGLREWLREIIVVDDGSTDATRAQAERAGALVLRHGRNQGKGAALRTGLTEAQQRGFAWAMLLDGDGQHRPTDLPLFFGCAERTEARLVIGNRLHHPQALPWLRRRVNQWMSRQLSRRTGHPLPDSQCGFRLVSLSAWAALRLETNHFEVESEMLVAFLAAGHRVEFVPIETVGRGPHSRIHPLVDSWRWWQWWRQQVQCGRNAPPVGGREKDDTVETLRPARPTPEQRSDPERV